MGTTQPIKSIKELDALKDYYLSTEPNLRNYTLIILGVNTALRIGDILSLTWNDVYDFDTDCFRKHIIILEHKTGKKNMVALNNSVVSSLTLHKEHLPHVTPSMYIFTGRHENMPLSRSQAFRVIKHACAELHLPENISCHSLRKTFGYHAWSAGANSVVLMLIFNHSSFQVTKRYLGIEQENKDQIFLSLNL